MSPPGTLCAVLTAHNRRPLTIASLAALEASAALAGVSLRGVLVDDASRDGTPAAVAARFPWMRVESGSGDLYWCRGMHRAFALAMAERHAHYLWLNDDTLLEASAVPTLLACLERVGGAAIVVGTTADPATGRRTYGGERRESAFRRLRFAPVEPQAVPVRCDSMSGNIVLVPAAVAARVGNLDPTFEHAMGDSDYALRAARAGIDIWLAPGILGTCRANETAGTYLDASLPLARRWRLMLGRKGLPWRSWLHFVRRHGGALWPVRFAWPYVRLVLSGAFGRRMREAGR